MIDFKILTQAKALNMVTENVENLYKIFVSQQSEIQW